MHAVLRTKCLQEIIPTTNNNNFNRQFLDLLKKIFVYDPSRRISAKDALKHPWFNETITDDGTEALRIRRERNEAHRLASAEHTNGYR